MKKIKSLFFVFLIVLSGLLLVACDGGGSNKGSKKEDVEALKTNLENVLYNLEYAEYNKFYMTYDINSESLKEDIEIGFDVNGYFYCSQTIDEAVGFNGAEPKRYTYISYVYVEDGSLTTTYNYYKKGYNNNTPIRRYWVEQLGEQAIETFIDQFGWVSETKTFISPDTPDVYVINQTDEFLNMFLSNVDRYLDGEEDRWTFTITKNEENNIEAIADYKNGQAEDQYKIVIENGILTAYSDTFLNQEFTLTTDLTYEKPDLSIYDNFSN